MKAQGNSGRVSKWSSQGEGDLFETKSPAPESFQDIPSAGERREGGAQHRRPWAGLCIGSQDFPGFGRLSLRSRNKYPENETGGPGNPALPYHQLVWPLHFIELTKERENVV